MKWLPIVALGAALMMPTAAAQAASAVSQVCATDVKQFCAGVMNPGGRPLKDCMKTHFSDLSEDCQEAIVHAAHAMTKAKGPDEAAQSMAPQRAAPGETDADLWNEALKLGTTPAPAPAAAPVHATMAQQDECSQRAHTAADKWFADASGGLRVWQWPTVESHFSARTGVCMVLVHGDLGWKYDPKVERQPIADQMSALFDAVGGHGFGNYYWTNPNRVAAPPADICAVQGVYDSAKPCSNFDDWYAAATKYMVD